MAHTHTYTLAHTHTIFKLFLDFVKWKFKTVETMAKTLMMANLSALMRGSIYSSENLTIED